MKTSENREIKPSQISALSPKPRKYLTENIGVYSNLIPPSTYNYSIIYNQFCSKEGIQKGAKFVFTVLILTSIESLCESVVCVSTIAHRN